MKWIKASERLPKNPGRYFVKVGRQSIPDNGDKNQVATFTSHKEWYLENHHHSRDFYYICPVEWLDEQGDAIPADLEQRAKEWVKQHESWVPDEQSEGAMFNAYLAGAQSVGGDVETFKDAMVERNEAYNKLQSVVNGLVHQLRAKNPYPEPDAYDEVWVRCCDTLQSLLTSAPQPSSMEGEESELVKDAITENSIAHICESVVDYMMALPGNNAKADIKQLIKSIASKYNIAVKK